MLSAAVDEVYIYLAPTATEFCFIHLCVCVCLDVMKIVLLI